MDPTPAETARTAIDELPLPSFHRAASIITERTVDEMKRVERDLRDVHIALGLAG